MKSNYLTCAAAGVLCLATVVACTGDTPSRATPITTEPLATQMTQGPQVVHLGMGENRTTATRVTAEGADAAGISAASLGHVGMRAALAAFVARGPLALVLVDRPLAGHALAEVYLNEPAPLSRYLVVSRGQLNDEILDRAHALARKYETENPNDHGRVKFTLAAGGTYDETTASGTSHGTQLFEGHYSAPDRRSRWLLESAQRVAPSAVPGVGEGRVMSLGTVPRK